MYRRWRGRLPEAIEICPIQLPGREGRVRERPIEDLDELVASIAGAISGVLDLPFVLFGHSMGAMLGFEVARRLRDQELPTPRALIVSGRRAPHVPNPDPPIGDLPDDGFLEEIRQLNGIPDGVLQSAELVELILPALRADYRMCETREHQAGAQLDCPIFAYGGLSDAKVDRPSLDAWREHTTGPFVIRMFQGDHFFLNDPRSMFRQALYTDLDTMLGDRR